MESNKLEYKLYNKSVVVCTNDGSNQNVIVICCFFSLGPISGMAKCSPFWAGHGSSGYVFRASFARLSLEIVKKKWVDTISYLVFRGSSANLSPTCTFLERYLSRRHFKSMPVDLDYIKPFMGFCTTLIYIYISQYKYPTFKYCVFILPVKCATCATIDNHWLMPISYLKIPYNRHEPLNWKDDGLKPSKSHGSICFSSFDVSWKVSSAAN